MNEIILIKNGELALKGLNRATFEDTLMRNLRHRLAGFGRFKVQKAQSTIVITPQSEGVDLDGVCEAVGKVFGIAAFSRCLVTEKDFSQIAKAAPDYLRETLSGAKTFKVNAKRSDKAFPMTSPQLQSELGGVLLSAFPHLKVDVHNPEVTVTVEIRDHGAYLHAGVFPGAGGLPVSTSGEALLLISGGIDSPVAGYYMAKRGLKLSAIHFAAPPYTSDRALEKVETLLQKVAAYAGDITFYCVGFTRLQEAIRDHCPEDLFTVIMRRMMLRIAIRVAEAHNLPALITGENLAQVASQTLYALHCTNLVSDRLILRPLIGLDKRDIIETARKIDTFETSILPYEDCCTVFTPRRPRTRPLPEKLTEAEALFDFEPLIEEAVAQIQVKTIRNGAML